jgi:glyoxylase I family protein
MAPRPPFRFHGLDHVVLNITALERSLHFYTVVLGMQLERIIDDFGIYQLRCGRSLIDLQMLRPGQALAEQSVRGVGHVCVLVDGEMGAVVEHLAAHRVELQAGPMELYGATGFGTSIYVLDPDGHALELKVDHAEFAVRAKAGASIDGLSRPPPAART